MTRHRAWELLKAIAYYAAAWVLVVGGALLIGGCATSDEVRLRMKLEEVTQERNDLLRFAVKQDEHIRRLEGGMIIQAREAAKLRDTCEL